MPKPYKKPEISLLPASVLVDRYHAYIERTGMSHSRFGNFAKINKSWYLNIERDGGMSRYRYDQVRATMRRHPDGVQEDKVPVKSLTQAEIQRRREAREAQRQADVKYWLDRENAPENYFGTRTPVEMMLA